MSSPPLNKAIFLDRDGTLIVDTGYCSNPADVKLIGGVQELLHQLKEAGFKLVIVTNQSGIGRGYFGEREFWAVQKEFERQVGDNLIDATYFCPDTPENASERRKPNPGMLLEAANDLGIDLTESYMIGDKVTDTEAGVRAGVKASILVSPGAPKKLSASGAAFVVRDLRAAAQIILAGQFR
jgi:D-glycero-D-manno-heptose 1,7-bisphosphate phosphatase